MFDETYDNCQSLYALEKENLLNASNTSNCKSSSGGSEEASVRPPAIVKLNLKMLKDLLDLCPPEKLGRQYLPFKYIEICAIVKEISPL